jgi:Tautomerase enzyme
MPLLHISLRDGKPEAYRRAICDGLYRVMRETLAVPEDDQFMIVTEHEAANFRYGNAYGVTRSDDLVYIQNRVRHPHPGTKKSAVPADHGASWRKSRHPRGRRVCDRSHRRERELVRRPRPRAICLRRLSRL